MRNKVIDLLKDKEVSPQEKFNQALMYYRNSAHPNPGLVRGYNVKGYSAQRLEELLYDVKKAFSISDKDLSEKSTKVINLKVDKKPKAVVPTEMPSFSKGAKGNAERKALVAELGLTAESNKNVDLETAIQNAIDTEAAKAAPVAPEAPEETDEEKQQKAETEAFNKVVAVLEAGEVCPPSFVREAFDNKNMTDDEVTAIIEKAQATLPEPPKGTISKEEALEQAEKVKKAKADSKKK
ncbi:hypothetical protein [Bizionia sp.]|uniref:hypothetical protein n=1 Tax=Bizionia sp. TaxID=1954480 RepID=UPI003A93995C